MELTGRADARERLERGRFDLLVIGGGIVGAGIANEAAHAGLQVALLDRSDFGAATSSASSKLIHGGLRYLRLGDVRLVREAHAERRALLRIVAPHLVRRLPFLLPLYRHGPYRPATIRVGLGLYSALAGDRLGGLLDPGRARRSVPDLRLQGLRGCGVYSDAWTNDSRLCLANVRAAAEAGAAVLNYAEVTALRLVGGRVAGAEALDVLAGESFSVQAKAVVNATGPWIDRVRRLEDPGAAPYGRLSKGVHVLVRLERPWSAALAIPHDAVRVTFAYPWEGTLLLGTTDTLYEGDPADCEATPAEVEQVRAEASVAVEPELLRHERVLSVFAGLRVLPVAEGEPVSSRRETVLLRGRGGMLTVAGGKLTTYRRIALGVLAGLAPELGLRRLDRHPRPLPGAASLGEATGRLARRHPELEPAVRSNLAHLYGSLAGEVLAEADGDLELLDRLHPEGVDIAAQVVYAARREWACRSEDVLRRRTSLALRGLVDAGTRERVDELLGRVAADVSSARR